MGAPNGGSGGFTPQLGLGLGHLRSYRGSDLDSDTEMSYLNDVTARPMVGDQVSVDGFDITIEFLEIDKRVRAHFLF